jgi:hypothetical protein
VTWPVLKRSVELTHAVPLVGDLLGVDGLIGAPDQRCKRTVVAVGTDPADVVQYLQLGEQVIKLRKVGPS